MEKRKSVKRELAEYKAKATREWKREQFAEVCKKDKVETIGDVCAVFFGLSNNAVKNAAYRRIQELAAFGCSPSEIIERMEPDGGRRK
jgi:hypothetical protein